MADENPLRLILREPGGAERSLRFDGEVVRVGRARDCELLLDSGYISRYHARFERTDGEWAIVDDGSKNGVFVNGRRVSDRQTLHPNDMVRLGDHTAVFAPSEPVAADEAGDGEQYDRTLVLPPGSLTEPALPRERLMIDAAARSLTVAGKPPRQPLTPREFRLVETLDAAGSAPGAYPRVTLMDVLWGPGGADTAMLDRLAQRVRDKIEADPDAPEFLLEETPEPPAARPAAGPSEGGYRLNRA